MMRGCTSRRRCSIAAKRSAKTSPSERSERQRNAVRAREVGEVVLPEAAVARAVEHRAHRQHRVRRVAGEDVRAAGAVAVQQPSAVGVAPLQLGRVARVVRDDRLAARPSPTSGRPACRGWSRAGSPPGRRPSARTSRSPSAPAGGRPRAPSARASARCRRAARAAARRARARRSRGRGRRARRSLTRQLRALSWRTTTWRVHRSPLSSASTAPAIDVIAVSSSVTASAVPKSSTWTP